MTLQLRSPASRIEWDAYYDLRWRMLRAPWGQPRGSERDSLDDDASFHVAAFTPGSQLVGGGRLHLNSPDVAQVRFMAVDPGVQRQGVGSAVLRELEADARRRGCRQMVLNARDAA